MILALNGRGEIIGRFNDDGTRYQDPEALGIYENDIYYPTGSSGNKGLFDKILGGAINVLQVLFPTGIKNNSTTYDPYTPVTTGTGSGTQTSSTFSGLGWVVAFLVLAYFVFKGNKK
ncbi:hypothetical protein [Runella sp.]|uniref:hypothetical protein n=1 Tax=Runella sp. TaxID=1960881 RepID=UPI003D0E4E01